MRSDNVDQLQAQTIFGRPAPARPWLCLMFVLATVGLSVSLYLAYVSLTGSKVVGCSGGRVFDCEHVFHSRWAKWWGMPVSLPASGIYMAMLTILGVLLSANQDAAWRRRLWGFATIGTGLAASAGLWFVFLQFAVVGKLCLYCLGVHSIGLALFAISMALSPVAWGSAWRLSGVAALGLAGIVTGQLASSESPSFEVQWNTPSASQEEAAEMVALDDPESMDSPDELAAPEETSAPMMAIMDAPEEASELSTPELSVELPIVQPNMEAEETINVLAIETAPAPTHTPVPEMDDASKEVNEVQPGAATETETDKVANEAKASEKAAAAAPVADRSLQLASINLKFQTRGRPVIGKSDAPVMFVELFDYTCQHCRKFNRQWQMVKQRFGDQVALMPLVVPLCLQCNPQVTSTAPGHENACEIGLIALAVWRLKPDQFEAFHDWLCEPESGRDLSEARSRANQIVGSELLSAELSGVMIGKHLSQHVELYRRLQKGTLPKLVSEQMTLTGVPESPESLCSQVEAVLVASRKN